MTLADLLASAEDTPDPRAYISRVKTVMAEFERLDATARIEDTHYFNHSAIPDFVVTWEGERAKREVFLRHSYESVDDADDEQYLADADAMVVALRPANEEPEARESSFTVGSRLLVTDTAAVDVIGSHESAQARPLTTLVQANFLRGARGHVGPARAEQLLQMDEALTPAAGEQTQSLIAESFAEDAAARITRTAELIALALDREQQAAPTVRGQLSLAELRSLLPWLLRQENARSNAAFWRYAGTLFTFEDLEGIRHDLAGLDVSPLVHANAGQWHAKRAYVVLLVSSDEPEKPRDGQWSFENGALGVDIGSHRLYLAHRGTMLKKRPGSVSPAWARVQPTLDGQRIGSIELKGIRRSVRLTAEESPDIRADVEEVTQSLDDAYFVDRVTVRAPAPGNQEGLTNLEIRYDEGLVVADTGATLTDLSSAALNVLELGRDLAPGAVDSLLGIATPGAPPREIEA
ncbi:hypothetical protein [Curtobacterium sp. PhB136]|uniref:hypothetical protein n=1 Tax=Curtobacterium sp. PhB136 TaxID=2485181 RepID=UPI0010477994|nr:hypothetical protein [Curtobacterium sp. PhB136]TCK63137.1 hypothetical protein EDF27_2803 [Curtobacterium sp. PhB136]